VETDSLDLTGSTVSLEMQFGSGLESRTPINPSLPVCLVRLANSAVDFLSCTSDPNATLLTGSYNPESASSGDIQLGEFALVQAVPEPSSFVPRGYSFGGSWNMPFREVESEVYRTHSPRFGRFCVR
jgi:hypothetical protein